MSNAQPCAEKIFINLNAPVEFQLRQKILGENNGANLHYIVNETKANISLRGRGSGFIEQNGTESNEPLHFLVEHPALKNLIEAKSLAKNLIETIQQELATFLQTNTQQNQQAQQPPPIIHTSNQQITIPQAVLSCPPPSTIIQQPTHIIQQQNFIPQQQIIPHNVPMQIIQQTPPPIRTPIVQFQGQTIQPANIQIQSANGGQQIVLNQAPAQQFQLQYIPSTNQITNAPQMQTIQHVIQPHQQIQGIIQPGANGQQYITVQGNTAFMIPPPNIIQQNPPQNINAVFNQPPTMNLNQEDMKNDPSKMKQEDQKNNQNMQQMGARIVTNIPPPILNCPPPQIFNQQAPQQQIQQFIVNTTGWPQQQQLQQLPMNSQIQILTQPATIRSGNEIVLQNPITSTGQQLITYSPQQGAQPFQQIQFHQATITQPPPSQPQIHVHNINSNHQNISFQQQFEQKINQSCELQLQQRTVKRKFEGETDGEPSNRPKTGMGQSSSDRPLSPKAKSRLMMTSNPPNQLPAKLSVNNSGPVGDNMNKRNNQNKLMFNRNVNPGMSIASTIQKNVNTSVESKLNKSTAKNENDSQEGNEVISGTQFTPQNHANQSSFMMRSGNQNYRFQGPQNFIHQQPPPMAQNSQFSSHRGQIMSNSSMNMYQSIGQSQMMQQPPPTTATHQFIQQDMNAYQHANNNFHSNNQQGNINRLNVPQHPQQQQQMQMQHHQQQQQQHHQQTSMGGDESTMMTGNYQQQPRFRQW